MGWNLYWLDGRYLLSVTIIVWSSFNQFSSFWHWLIGEAFWGHQEIDFFYYSDWDHFFVTTINSVKNMINRLFTYSTSTHSGGDHFLSPGTSATGVGYGGDFRTRTASLQWFLISTQPGAGDAGASWLPICENSQEVATPASGGYQRFCVHYKHSIILRAITSTDISCYSCWYRWAQHLVFCTRRGASPFCWMVEGAKHIFKDRSDSSCVSPFL
jgi:hypothetical protein